MSSFLDFFSHEAERSGKTVTEEIDDFYAEWDSAVEEDKEILRREALPWLRKMVDEWNRYCGGPPWCPRPYALIALETLEYCPSFAGTDTRMIAHVRSTDGIMLLTVTESEWFGTRIDPPDYDMDIEWKRCPEDE